MNYLSKIGSNAKKAFNKLQKCDHKNIKKVLNTYNKKILKNKNSIIRENNKDIKNIKRKLRDFSDFLIKEKYARVFDGSFQKPSYKPLNEVKRVADLVVQNFTNDYVPKSIDLDTF